MINLLADIKIGIDEKGELHVGLNLNTEHERTIPALLEVLEGLVDDVKNIDIEKVKEVKKLSNEIDDKVKDILNDIEMGEFKNEK